MPARSALAAVAALAACGGAPASPRLERMDRGLPAAGQWRAGFAVADLDGDGRLDLIHGPPRKGGASPVFLLGDGAGGFRRWTGARLPPAAYGYGDAAAGDVDGDGRLDLVFAVHNGRLIVLHGLGEGRWEDRSPSEPFSSRAVEIADVDGDGQAEILALSDGPLPGVRPARGLAVFGRDGDGWTLRRATGGGFGDSLASGDVDGDGRRDLLVASGELGAARILSLDGGASWQPLPGLRAEAVVRAVALADLDGDGRADPITSTTRREGDGWRVAVDVFPSRAGMARRQLLDRPGSDEILALAGCRLGGGVVAVGLIDGDGALAVYLRDGTLVARQPVPPVVAGCRGAHLECADLDGDGRDELVAAYAGEDEGDGRCRSGGALTAWRVSR